MLLWVAAGTWAYAYLPPLDENLTGGVSDLVPEAESAASRPAALAPPGARTQSPEPEGGPSSDGGSGGPSFSDGMQQEEPREPPSVLGSVEAPAVLVYSDPGGIDAAERGIIEEDVRYLNGPYGPRRLELAVPLAVPGALAEREVSGGQRAFPVLLFFEAGASGTSIRNGVEEIRRTLGGGPLGVEVTGIRPVQEDTISAVKENLGKVTLATALAIFCILAFAYRSLVAPLVPLASIGLATFLTLRLVAYFATERGTPVPSQVEPVIVVLLFGVGTDYALFLLSRTRQALRMGSSRVEAARLGVERAGGVIFSSAAVLVASFAVLVRAELEVYKTLGPGLGLALVVLTLVTLTLVPALLAILGRGAFGGVGEGEVVARPPASRCAVPGSWRALWSPGCSSWASGLRPPGGLRPGGRPPRRRAGGAGVRGALFGLPAGDRLADQRRGGGDGIAGRETELGRLENELWGAGGFAAVLGPGSGGILPRVPFVTPDGDGVRFLLVPYGDPYSPGSLDQIDRLKGDLPALLERTGLSGAEADVGGQAVLAEAARSVSAEDLAGLAPLVLAAAFVVLALLLRTPVAPVYLLGATVLSFAATLGVAKVLFQDVLGQDGVVYYVPFTLFILLVALGSDYNIFIMSAIREEAREKPLPEAVAAALAGTSRTINAAGLALAASFALLVLIPLQDFLQVGFAVALGILLDAFVIRTLLVPALVLLAGRAGFWPGKVRS
ncbi:MMPL family transporter [Rubrobacter marinus]|uniref:MMPL family transporter n=1 Tax=Rubrobacter marinus TaxID=2653852 RepID=A0A6G8PVK4_9ACTN|nr:MMPL family transporter [Rubrobacter marinus]QIN78238.1 MMPL family transporter [Rubrobacter marinus]